MDINIGSKIKYTFPNPSAVNKRFAIGTVELVDEFYFMMLTNENVRIKINFKNFGGVEVLDSSGEIDLPEAV